MNEKKKNYCYFCGPTVEAVFKCPSKESSGQKKWLAFCNMKTENAKSLALCMKHFEDHYIHKGVKRVRLVASAVPTKRINIKHDISDQMNAAIQYSQDTNKRKKKHNCRLCGPTLASVFKFPRDDHNRYKKWLTFCNITAEEEVSYTSYLCEKHFPVDSIVQNPIHKRLRKHAIPKYSDGNLESHVTEEIISIQTPNTNSPIHSMNYETSHVPEVVLSISTPTTLADCETSHFMEEILTRSSCSPMYMASSETSDHRDRNISLPPPPSTSFPYSTPKSSKKNPRFLGDIDLPLLNSPSTRMQCLRVIRYQNAVTTKKIKMLNEANKRLHNKVRSLKELLKELQKQNFISKDISKNLWVRIQKEVKD